MWGCVSAADVGNLIRRDEKVYTMQKEVLKKDALPLGKRFTLEQDNDPKHIARCARSYLFGRKTRFLIGHHKTRTQKVHDIVCS